MSRRTVYSRICATEMMGEVGEGDSTGHNPPPRPTTAIVCSSTHAMARHWLLSRATRARPGDGLLQRFAAGGCRRSSSNNQPVPTENCRSDEEEKRKDLEEELRTRGADQGGRLG